MKYWICQIFLISVIFASSCVSHNSKRVIGGEEAPPDKYRWAVSIKGNVDKLRVSGACGASILKTEGNIRWLVTAAHCFFPSDGRVVYDLTKPKLWHARVGLTKVEFEYQKHGLGDKFKEGFKSIFNKAYRKFFGKDKFKIVINDLHIKKIFIHPSYRPLSPTDDIKTVKYDDDIALMKLKESLQIDKLVGVSTIELPLVSMKRSWPEIGSECIVVGWGCTAPNAPANPIAKLAKLKIWSHQECLKAVTDTLKINPITDFCAGYLKQKYGMCQGDSGSGLICNYNNTPYIAGIVSRGQGGNPGDYPAVFTRVSSFTSWIKDIVANN